MDVTIARYSGFCYGVRRAVDIVRQLVAEKRGPIHILGNLIHNPTVVEELSRAGVRKVGSVDEVESGILVVRSHGATRQVVAAAKRKRLELIDTTCPNVKKAQVIAQKVVRAHFTPLIIGDQGHAEVEGILSYTGGRGLVVSGLQALQGLQLQRQLAGPVAVICQTTIHLQDLREVVDWLVQHTREIRVHNTICDVTSQRQASTLELARKVDLMLIVGGRESANTSRLAEISAGTGVKTFHIESEGDLDAGWFRRDMRVGLSAGASTPSEVTLAVEACLRRWEQEGRI